MGGGGDGGEKGEGVGGGAGGVEMGGSVEEEQVELRREEKNVEVRGKEEQKLCSKQVTFLWKGFPLKACITILKPHCEKAIDF